MPAWLLTDKQQQATGYPSLSRIRPQMLRDKAWIRGRRPATGESVRMLENLALGFDVALTLNNLMFCLIGCLIGTAIGVLPGIGPVATISLLLPITFGQPATTAIIMLAGIYYGAQYGGSTTAILLNLPGEVSSVVTTLEGYKMARNGRAGAALTVAALGSFFAGTVSTLVVAASGPLLTSVALSFGPADYFSLMFLGLVISAVLARGFGGEVHRHGDARRLARHGRHGRADGSAALHLRHPGTVGRRRLRLDGHGYVRHRRDHLEPRAARGPLGDVGQDRQADDDPRGVQAGDPGGAARHPSSAPCSASCRAAARRCPPSVPT
jgi:hypothetical protein